MLATKLAINLRWDDDRALWLAKSRWRYASTGPITGSLDIIAAEGPTSTVASARPYGHDQAPDLQGMLQRTDGVLERRLPHDDEQIIRVVQVDVCSYGAIWGCSRWPALGDYKEGAWLRQHDGRSNAGALSYAVWSKN